MILARFKVIIYCAFSRNHFMEGCFTFQWGGRMGGGFILKWEVRPIGGIGFDRGFSKKIVGWGEPPSPLCHYGKPWNNNQHPWDTISANFCVNQTTLTFLAQICPKMNLGLQLQKTNVGIRISILQIPGVPIFRQDKQRIIFWPKFAQILNFGLQIWN